MDLHKDFESGETCRTIILNLVYPQRLVKLCLNVTYGEVKMYLAYFLPRMASNKEMLYRQAYQVRFRKRHYKV
jgi:hypothetical protein